MPIRALTLALWLCVPLVAATSYGQGRDDFIRMDPEKIVLPEECGACHQSEHAVWRRTPHATGFDTLHKKESAEEIADRLGFRLIKRESACLKCHYTPIFRRGQLRAGDGVTCESCHGAARDWINVHNDYSAREAVDETPEHRRERIEQSIEAGMLRPSDLYSVASNCYQCHTVPHEELVNVGRHSTGSAAFELVSWSQGEMRHNFLKSFIEADGTINAERSPEYKRVMYVIGKALDLEYSLRGVAAATENGRYVKAMGRRSRNAIAELRDITEAVSIPELEKILETVRSLPIELGSQAALLEAADAIGEVAKHFLAEHDGTSLASLDPFYLEPRAPRSADEASEDTLPDGVAVTDALVPEHRTTRPVPCGSCHGDQEAWWYEDRHATTAERFLDEAPRAVQIAAAYGLDTDAMKRGDQVCMQCHATVVSGREARAVADGVSCQRCHGPGEDYKKPHEESYEEALRLGMVALHDLTIRARTCTGCHYITDPKLLSTGHRSGADFDYAAAMSGIRHWEAPFADGAEVASVFAAVVAERGPVPEVTVVAAPPPAPLPETSPNDSTLDVAVEPADTKAPPATTAGRILSRPAWHLEPEHATTRPVPCGSCHDDEQDWWFEDPHASSAEPFLDEDPKYQKIARFYGIRARDMKKGNQICMQCHGTVVSGREARDVGDGVGCQKCHGAGADYKEPHEESYERALELGMVALRDGNVRAASCSQCHYISDPRLLAVGHPTGAAFDVVGANAKIRHWKEELAATGALAASYRAATAERGGIFPAAASASPSEKPTTAVEAPTSEASPAIAAFEDEPSMEEVLLLLKERLEELYRQRASGSERR